MSRWIWTDEPSEGWCGDHATRDEAIAEAKASTPYSFQVAEVDRIPEEEGQPFKFLRMEEIAGAEG